MLSKKEAFILSAYTGILCTDDVIGFYEYLSQVLGRSFINIELANPKLWKKIRKATKHDFLKIIHRKDKNVE